METTTRSRPTADPKKAPEAASEERARARSYLDLWERHLVLTAMEGLDPGPFTPRS